MSASCSKQPQAGKVKITQIQGKVKLTDVYQPDVAMCIPAAHTWTASGIRKIRRNG